MNLVSLTRATQFALQNIRRNIWLALVTTIILFVTLFSIAFSSSINFLAEQATQLVKDRIDVSIYFAADVLEEDVRTVQNALLRLPEVRDVTYVSKEEALARFRDQTIDNAIIQETLDVLNENPLGAALIVRARDVEDFPAILTVLDDPAYADLIEDRDFEENRVVIDRISDVSSRIRQIGYAVSGVFALIAILVIINTIRITIYTHRDEIGIMKLVGASNWFVRAPLVIESILYAVVASLLASLTLILVAGVSAPFLNSFFAGYNFDLLAAFQGQLWIIIGLQLVVGVILAVISSLVAIGRHLKV